MIDNDIIELETCVKDAFYLFSQVVDMIEDHNDHRNLIAIKKLIESKILVHEPYVHTTWLKKQVQEVWETLDEYEVL